MSNILTTLPELPGFDTATAMKQLANNQKLYGNVLKRFAGQYRTGFDGLAAKLADLPPEGEALAEAQREVHTLKGLAGTIGHPALQEAAVRFDAAAKEPGRHSPEELKALGGELLARLREALDVLQAAFPEA
ncbi:MAG: Hpt domain-containing protein [Deltaproteobacteria bacterium]|jgi:HPt (histidine-containing phosphotransfer) domain-containing protein|nr:Hpt domain-containing protein [Deltaproteobacteria bacterium]